MRGGWVTKQQTRQRGKKLLLGLGPDSLHHCGSRAGRVLQQRPSFRYLAQPLYPCARSRSSRASTHHKDGEFRLRLQFLISAGPGDTESGFLLLSDRAIGPNTAATTGLYVRYPTDLPGQKLTFTATSRPQPLTWSTCGRPPNSKQPIRISKML